MTYAGVQGSLGEGQFKDALAVVHEPEEVLLCRKP
jgi:hypothetical protein